MKRKAEANEEEGSLCLALHSAVPPSFPVRPGAHLCLPLHSPLPPSSSSSASFFIVREARRAVGGRPGSLFALHSHSPLFILIFTFALHFILANSHIFS
jgi:hypothetical protein